MRYFRETRVVLEGNKDVAASYIPFARTLMGIVQSTLAPPEGGYIFRRSVVPGVHITLNYNTYSPTIYIYASSLGGKRETTEENFIALPVWEPEGFYCIPRDRSYELFPYIHWLSYRYYYYDPANPTKRFPADPDPELYYRRPLEEVIINKFKNNKYNDKGYDEEYKTKVPVAWKNIIHNYWEDWDKPGVYAHKVSSIIKKDPESKDLIIKKELEYKGPIIEEDEDDIWYAHSINRQNDPYIQIMLDLVNELREAVSAPPLHLPIKGLGNLSALIALECKNAEQFYHDSSDFRSPYTTFEKRLKGDSWELVSLAAGENIALTPYSKEPETTIPRVVDAWYDSLGHRNVMLNTLYAPANKGVPDKAGYLQTFYLPATSKEPENKSGSGLFWALNPKGQVYSVVGYPITTWKKGSKRITIRPYDYRYNYGWIDIFLRPQGFSVYEGESYAPYAPFKYWDPDSDFHYSTYYGNPFGALKDSLGFANKYKRPRTSFSYCGRLFFIDEVTGKDLASRVTILGVGLNSEDKHFYALVLFKFPGQFAANIVLVKRHFTNVEGAWEPVYVVPYPELLSGEYVVSTNTAYFTSDGKKCLFPIVHTPPKNLDHVYPQNPRLTGRAFIGFWYELDIPTLTLTEKCVITQDIRWTTDNANTQVVCDTVDHHGSTDTVTISEYELAYEVDVTFPYWYEYDEQDNVLFAWLHVQSSYHGRVQYLNRVRRLHSQGLYYNDTYKIYDETTVTNKQTLTTSDSRTYLLTDTSFNAIYVRNYYTYPTQQGRCATWVSEPIYTVTANGFVTHVYYPSTTGPYFFYKNYYGPPDMIYNTIATLIHAEITFESQFGSQTVWSSPFLRPLYECIITYKDQYFACVDWMNKSGYMNPNIVPTTPIYVSSLPEELIANLQPIGIL